MGNIVDEYSEIVKQISINDYKIKKLEENENVKEYLELLNKKKELDSLSKQKYEKLRMERYRSCSHVFVECDSKYDKAEGRSHNCFGCIKCGLNTGVLNNETGKFTSDEKVMFNYLKEHQFSINGIQIDYYCDLRLAASFYRKIKRKHPNIEEEKLNEILKEELVPALKNSNQIRFSFGNK